MPRNKTPVWPSMPGRTVDSSVKSGDLLGAWGICFLALSVALSLRFSVVPGESR
jgi:hypothetical protein